MLSTRDGAARASLRALLFVALTAGTSGAFAPPAEQRAPIDRLAPAAALDAGRAVALESALLRSAAWTDWTTRHPGCRVQWNLRTGTPHRLYGPGLRVAGAVQSATIEGACRDFLAANAALTGVRPQALRLIKAEHRLGRWYVIFEQVEDGIPVRGGRVDLRVGDGGEVMLLGSDWHRDVRVSRLPDVASDAALATASRDLQTGIGQARHDLVIVPEPQGDGYAYRLAWELHFSTQEPRGEWLALVDAHTGALLRREDQIRYAQLSGNISAQVESVTVGDPYDLRPLADTRFNGPTVAEFGFTDIDGNYDVTTTATDSVTVTTRLSGRWGRVYNQAHGLVTPTITTRMLPGSPRDFVWDDSNSQASERDPYNAAWIAHQKIKELDPAFTGVDYQMPIKVDIFDRDCNAFYDGFGINFFGQSQRCVNTARIADVVMHEYGHGITDQVYRPLAPSGAMHEGFSDYWAATIMNSPLIGRGFRGPGTILRTVDNTRRFPDDATGEVHNDGLIIAGALWDMRQALGKSLADTLFHFARYGGADNFDDYLLDVLVTDDDNADIYDGTPHFDAIIASFLAHGIGDYSVQIDHAPLADTEDLAKPLRIDATILSIFALDPTSLAVHWAANGGAWTDVPLAPAGTGSRDFTVTLPAQAANTTLAYYVTAADTAGHTAALPPGGVADPFTLRIGTDTTPPVIVHTPLGDRPIDAPGWPVLAGVTDNLDRGLAGVQLDYSRNSGALDQHLAMAPVALTTWRGVLPVAGASLGDSVVYRLVATDSASTPNAASAPAVGRYGFRVVEGFARDFEADDAGLVATGDWSWGEPTGFAAASPTHCWGTGIDGAYSNDQVSTLETAPIALTGWTRAALVFQHNINCEAFFDGGDVQISTNAGVDWQTIVPDGGYPFGLVQSLNGSGYSDNSHGWREAGFDLSRFVGQTVQLRWRFASDAGVVERGWFVDDIEVAARQLLVVPLGLQAQSGRDSQVPLAWSPPAGINPAQPGTPLTGYHVYRATQPDLGDAVRLTSAPLVDNSYTDATVVNGTVYQYYVTAVYAEGESPASRVAQGQPYVAGYASDIASLYVAVPDSGVADSSVTFQNTGTGFLRMNIWLGDAADADIDAVRIAYDLQNLPKVAPGTAPVARPRFDRADVFEHLRHATSKRALQTFPQPVRTAGESAWQLLHSDPQEGVAPDFSGFFVKETGGNILFKLAGWTPWGNPLVDFNTVISIDADADRSTGDANGNDLFVLAGPFALSQIGVPAVITTSTQQILGIPPVQMFPAGADSLIIGFPTVILGNTTRITLQAAALNQNLQVPKDLVPDARTVATWMQPEARFVSVPVGVPTALALHFPGVVPAGRYQGKIFLETNAPATPVATIPVTYDYLVTAIELRDLTAEQVDADVLVRWHTGSERDVTAFRVFRGRDGGPLEALQPDVATLPQHAYTYRDRDAAPGAYTYRVGEVGRDGGVTLHGNVTVVVTARAPLASFLDAAVPNPFNPTTALRFGIATRGSASLVLYDARGRRVRTLMRSEDAAPGTYRVTWDGRDDHGTGVASGVYMARFETAGRSFTRRLTLLK